MALRRWLLSFPLRRQTVIGALIAATVLFIVYQFNFVAELSDSSRQRNAGVVGGPGGKLEGPQLLHIKKREDKIINHVRGGGGGDGGGGGEPVGPAPRHKYDRGGGGSTRSKTNEKETQIKKSPGLGKEPDDVKDSGIKIFRCVASGKEISADRVNDDYCDCPEDGSDEPRTNACVNGKFVCLKHANRYPKSIPSAWVNDGVCDCCDGSDEWQMKKNDEGPPIELQRKVGRYLSPCPVLCN
ncbi:hypothetical protein Pcinc_034190 [Petrolisthes cinctipes]|uniref:Glucosidase II beta subunit N-terminal domain-containing protein n=1 Tax=Petrolisthes cinctipes TaxID=88211 RepID=A0AAE1BGE3_PETCI|nr:hypothetical protein Pcinc_043129 [Petrolisthes cinctipes]KAK3859713.1 hypothetical protein Pcinc_034190 [Petrolisthes cinctipes]